MDEVLELGSDDADEDEDQLFADTVHVIPSRPGDCERAPMPSSYAPHTAGTTDLREIFQMGRTPLRQIRFVNRDDQSQILTYTDGSCLDNGRTGSQAGCGVVFRDADPDTFGHLAFRLENKGPSGEPHPQTSNRAEMRAVLAALQLRYWPGEGLKSIIIATDSEYVVKGATEWVYRWQQNGWQTARGPVRNKDLWLALWEEFERWSDLGLQLYFWKIPRDLNAEADHWARVGAAYDEEPTSAKIHGIML